jgi:polygalacturonase
MKMKTYFWNFLTLPILFLFAFSSASADTSCAPAPTSSLVVNVKDTGATGNGSTDDTSAIQAAINQVGGTSGTVLVPDGTYMLDAVSNALLLKSNMTFRMTAGAILKVIPNGQEGYALIRTDGASNLNIIGGTLQGDRDAHTGTSGEWGMGIYVNEATDVVIDGVTSKDMWGDGFYVGGDHNGSSNITFCNVIADNNRRQGLSITFADGVVVKNSVFKNTHGVDPGFGIDIEPDSGTYVNNVNIGTSQFINNEGRGILLWYPNNSADHITINGVAQPNNAELGISDADAFSQ